MLLSIPIEQIDEGYARLRLTNPKAESNLLPSIQKYGQVSPVIVIRISSNRYEMVDGFKRLHVCRKLKYETLQAKPLSSGSQSLKAAMIFLNWEIRSITDLEEGMVIASLHREDNLSQTAIAMMLGRHKSWVCRRIGLVERLSDEALDHIKLGLINPTIGRELSKLPRGNQPALLQTVLKHRLTTRQTVNLVSWLQKEPGQHHDAILNGLNPEHLEALNQRSPVKTDHQHRHHQLSPPSNPGDICLEKLLSIERLLLGLLNVSYEHSPATAAIEEKQRISSTLIRIAELFDQIRSKLHRVIDSLESTTVSA